MDLVDAFLHLVEIAREGKMRSALASMPIEPATSLNLSLHLQCSCACSLGGCARHDLQDPAVFDFLRQFTLALFFGWCSKSELHRIAAVSTLFGCEPLSKSGPQLRNAIRKPSVQLPVAKFTNILQV